MRLTLTLYPNDGPYAVMADISTENKFPAAVSDRDIISARFWETFMVLQHELNPRGQPLPPELEEALRQEPI